MTPAPAKRTQLPALTGIRGIAAWWVVAYHFRQYIPLEHLTFLGWIFSGGYLAVDLFFVLSGFVIFLNYADLFAAPSRKGLHRFAAARIARIYPLHFLIMLLFIINPLAIHFFSSAHETTSRYGIDYFIASIFLVQNWGFFDHLQWNIPAWSISTEFFAYIIFPALGYCLIRYGKVPLAALLLGSSLVALAVLFALSGSDSIGSDIPKLGLARCLLEFTAGACICALYQQNVFLNRWLRVSLAPAIIVMLGAGFYFDVPDYVVTPIVCCLCIVILTMPRNGASIIFGAKPLVTLGEISYSTYLIHYFIRDWTKFLLIKSETPDLMVTVAYLLITFVASILLYRVVELPGKRILLRRFDVRTVKAHPPGGLIKPSAADI